MILGTLRSRIISGSVLVLVLLSMIGIAAFREIDKLHDHASWVEHTLEIISLINHVQSHVIHAESGQRGFLLTGDEQQLQHYYETVLNIDSDLEKLHRLTAETPEMQILTDSLSTLISSNLNRQEEVQTVYRESGFAPALQALKIYTDAHTAEDIHVIFAEMYVIEQELLAERTMVEALGINSAKQTIITISLLVAVVMILLVLLIMFRFVLPVTRLTAIATSIAHGDLHARGNETSSDEIGILSSSINEMTDSLINTSHVLEKEISRRKKEQEQLQAAFDEAKRSRLAILSIGEDLAMEVNERKKLQDLREKLITDLEHSNKDLEQFAYVASHDLQEPLRMVSSFTQLLAQRYSDQLDDEANEFIDFAVDGANRMQRQITDLLLYSRIGSQGKQLLPVNTGSALRKALANLQILIEETRATVTADDLPQVDADRGQLVTLFQNLIGNAIKFHGDSPPQVVISAEREGLYIHFKVTDNGIGMEQKYFSRIFTIFQRLHTAETYSGTGIGLAICERIVTRHQGKIWVESEFGTGSVFHFTMKAGKERNNGENDGNGD